MRTDYMAQVRVNFDVVTSHVLNSLRGDEQATMNLKAEETLFVRFNESRVRQNTDVQQSALSLKLMFQGRTVMKARTLSGNLSSDLRALDELLESCRQEIAVLEADPYQVPIRNNGNSDQEFHGELLKAEEIVNSILGPAQDCDLAGLYAGGVVIRANRNSAGQSHWFATETFVLDYSLYVGNKAVKSCYSGSHWDADQWRENLKRTQAQLALMSRPVVEVKPGRYRSYLAPSALSALLGMLGWNALSASAWKQGRSPFKKLIEKDVCLSAFLTLGENFNMGLNPRFNSLGEVSPPNLPLIVDGELKSLLVGSRTAVEYGLESNAAEEDESPRALDVKPGSLAQQDILKTLGTGLVVSNLHYLNWSDPVSARITGMTRYACFWVERGEIVGPIRDLRWDQGLYDALGLNLMALTSETEIDPVTDTYYARALGGSRVPGALIEDFTFTL